MTAINLNRTTEPAGVMAKPNVRIGHFKEGLAKEKRKPHHHITNKFALDMTRNQTHRKLDNEMRERKTYLDSHTQKEIRSHTTEHHAHDEFMHDNKSYISKEFNKLWKCLPFKRILLLICYNISPKWYSYLLYNKKEK